MPTDSDPAESFIIRTGSDGRHRCSRGQGQALLDAFERSGMSVMRFARQYGVHYQTFIAKDPVVGERVRARRGFSSRGLPQRGEVRKQG